MMLPSAAPKLTVPPWRVPVPVPVLRMPPLATPRLKLLLPELAATVMLPTTTSELTVMLAASVVPVSSSTLEVEVALVKVVVKLELAAKPLAKPGTLKL